MPEAQSANSSASVRPIDLDRPWLGLRSFGEEHTDRFFGRQTERNEILRCVEHRHITVLYGRSGLGKTSLIRAGLTRDLLTAGYQPIFHRIRYGPKEATPAIQLIAVLSNVYKAPISQNTDLYVLLHDPALGFCGPFARYKPPVFLLDQFEEVFTLGAEVNRTLKSRRDVLAEVRDVLAILGQNFIPEELAALLETDEDLYARLDQESHAGRVVLSLRDDYVFALDRWRRELPSVGDNRYELLPLTGEKAYLAVVEPGKLRDPEHPIVTAECAIEIVRFVAGDKEQRKLDELVVVPPLLSLICEQLNAYRIKHGREQIEPTFQKDTAAEILEDYYQSRFRDRPVELRMLVEEHLLSAGGHRQPVNVDTAERMLEKVCPNNDGRRLLDDLVAERLLTIVEHGSLRRFELTHDILCPIARRSRDARRELEEKNRLAKEAELAQQRQHEAELKAAEQQRIEEGRRKEAEQKQRDAEEKQREAESLRAQAIEAECRTRKALRRSRIYLILAILGLVFAVILAFTSAWNASRVQEQLARAQIEEGRAWIERAKLNSERNNNFAAALMAARALGFVGYGREKIEDPKFNEKYPVLLTTANDPIDEQEARREINEATLTGYFGWPLWQSPVYRQHEGPVVSVAWSPNGKTLASGSGDQTVKLWETATGKLLRTLQGHADEVSSVAWSPDGKILASGSYDQTVKLWEAATGKLLSTLQGHTGQVCSVAWSPDGKTLASGSSDQTVKLWEAATGKLLSTLQGHSDPVWSVAWSPDGKTLASGSSDQTVKLWEAATGKVLTTLQGHTGEVGSVAWSPDGKTLASGSYDQTVKLWEAATDKLLSTLQGHTGQVRSVAWSPDGKTLASGSFDHTVKLWDAATGKPLATLQGHTDAVTSVGWSPDGKTLASGSGDQTVKLWEAATGKLLTSLQGHTDWVYSVAWSPDGKTLASGSSDHTVRLWEAATGKLLSTLQGHTDLVLSIAWSPDGKTLASGARDQTVKLWEAATGKLLATLQGHTDLVYSVGWSPDGKTLASGSYDKTVKLWEAATSKVLTTLQGHTDSIYSVAWSPDGKTLASGARDKTVKLWEAATGKLLTTLQGHTDAVYSVAWSPDGKTLASGSGDKTVKRWEAATGKLLSTLQGHTGEVYSVAWSPDEKTLASGSSDKTVKLWEADTGKLLASFQGHVDTVFIVAWSPDGKTLASGSGDHTVMLWEAARGELLASLQGHTDTVWSVAWSPDGKTLASGSLDRTVKLWEADTGKVLSILQGHTGEVNSVAWSPDGKTLASGSYDKTVKLWEAATGKVLTTLQGHTDSIFSVAWSPDGKTLASGSPDHTVKLWEAATGKLLTSFPGHTDWVRSVAWSPDGKTLASGSNDQTVKLWEAATGKLLSTLQGHTGQVRSVAWSPDGKTLASGSFDHTVKLWEAATGKLLSTLQGHTSGVNDVAWSPDGKTLASGSGDQTVKLWEAATGKLLSTLQGHTGQVSSVAWSPDGKTLASGSLDHTVKLWEAPGALKIDLAEYLRSRWIRLAGSEMVWEANENLLHDRSFDVVNLRGTTLLGIERSGSVGSQKLAEQLSLFLRAGSFPEAVAIWNATSEKAADSPSRRMLLAALSATAADDLFSNTTWRGLWLTEQMQSMITSESMLDPAVSLGMLRLDIQLALAGSDETEVVSVRERFNARIAGMAPQSWFVALGRNLVAAATKADAANKEREAALDELRRLTKQIPDSAELRQMLVDALRNLGNALGVLGNQLEGEEGLKQERESVELLRDVVSNQPDDLSRYQLASALGNLAFRLVLNGQFAEAQTRCEEAQSLANEIGDGVQKRDRDNLIFIQGNLAHALLFQGHYDKALAIYRQYWDKPLNGKTFGEVTLEDFAAFDKAGLTHPDLARMKQALGDLRSKAPSP
jgi:WD40 repeat protein